MRRVLSILLLSFVLIRNLSGAASTDWHTETGHRWASLSPQPLAGTGFTRLDPTQTGILFTNQLEEWQGAFNRVLLNGSGVGIGDYNHDGLPDLFFCALNNRSTLFKNLGGMRFQDATVEAAAVLEGKFFRGAVFADVNGDGFLDLLITSASRGAVYLQNDGRGKFENRTAVAGLASNRGSMTMALSDFDGNGTLDLYVANNRTDDIRDRGQVKMKVVNGKPVIPPQHVDRLIFANGQLLEMGEPDQLFRNDGTGRFTELSWTGGQFRDESGQPLSSPPRDWGLSATFRDINQDGWPDLYVCNDFWTPDRIWINDGTGRFRALPHMAVRSLSSSSMGVDFADLDADGYWDFFVVDMLSRSVQLRKRQSFAQPFAPYPLGLNSDRVQLMRNTFFHNRGDGTFAEIAHSAGLQGTEWSWQPLFLDVDLDGREDLLITTGHAKDVQDRDANREIALRQHPWDHITNEVQRQKLFTQEIFENQKLYPRLETPIVAYRNVGDLHFQEMTSSWGTDTPGVHHGIATADLDGDGDQDLVVNNLGSTAGVYLNRSASNRIAVRLKGMAPNTQAIGAKVRCQAPGLPPQLREVISGGRYTSGSDPELVFATGPNTASIALSITWPNGDHSELTVLANRRYEIDQPKSALRRAAPPPAPSISPALFEDVTDRLAHSHHESPYDDFARQPLLPFKLSQGGPAVAWVDLDQDGREELLIGAGRGGKVAALRVTAQGQFTLLESSALPPLADDASSLLGWTTSPGKTELWVGLTGYEALVPNVLLKYAWAGPAAQPNPLPVLLPGLPSTIGPMAVGDMDGDGDLDLFVAGGIQPGRYPESDPCAVYRNTPAGLRFDETTSSVLRGVGWVQGVVWSDLNNDGFPELVLSCGWGPVRVFQNETGLLAETTRSLGLETWTGWWTGLATADLDNDGRMDLVVGNWGENSPYSASPSRPLELLFGDLADRGTQDLIETEWDSDLKALVPRRDLDDLAASFPFLKERFPTYLAYSKAGLPEVFAERLARARRLQMTHLSPAVFYNRGDHFEPHSLPREAGVSPVWGVTVADFDGDGWMDLFLAQNFFSVAPPMSRLDAGRGLLLINGKKPGAFAASPASRSGIEIYGEQRSAAVADFDEDGRMDLVVTQNAAPTRLFRNRGAVPGQRVRVKGPPGNPSGIGATIQLIEEGHRHPVQELHAGSGYRSQDSTLVLVSPKTDEAKLTIRWPGGRVSTTAVPRAQKELVIEAEHSGTGK